MWSGVGGVQVYAKKMEYRCTPTFVNLKSNTMKNTHAKIYLFYETAIKTYKKVRNNNNH